MSERVADRDIEAAVTAGPGPVIPDGARWTVVLDGGGQPAAAIAPGGTSVTSSLVVVDAALPVAAAVESNALASAPADTVVVVTSGSAVVGVWAGEDLIDALVHGATREVSPLPGDIQLPGRIAKQDITRRCKHTEQGRACATVLVVPEKPDPMPSCPAQSGISAHVFAW